MSIHTVDEALDFLPSRESARPAQGFLTKISTLFKALAEGQRAAADYDRLVTSGMGAAAAANTVFERHFKGR